jgi:hypothetical protein
MSCRGDEHEDYTKRVLVVYKPMWNVLWFIYLFVVYLETFSVSKHIIELNDIMVSE